MPTTYQQLEDYYRNCQFALRDALEQLAAARVEAAEATVARLRKERDEARNAALEEAAAELAQYWQFDAELIVLALKDKT